MLTSVAARGGVRRLKPNGNEREKHWDSLGTRNKKKNNGTD